MKIHYGFFETPDVPRALERAAPLGLALEPDSSTFFLGRETLVPGEHPDLQSWRITLYIWLASNALAPAQLISSCRPTAWSSSARRSRSNQSSA